MRNAAIRLIAWTWWVAAAASPLTAGPLHETVHRAVEGLASPRAAERRAAEEALLTLGPSALPHLPEPGSLPDRAAQEALARIQQTLETRAAVDWLQPSRVTYRGRGTPAELLREISRQTGNTVPVPEAADELPACEVAWERATFWAALTEVEQRCRWRLWPRVVADAQSVLPDAGLNEDTATAFRITWEPMTTRAGTAESQPKLHQIRLRLEAEPRLQPLFVRCRDAAITVRVDGVTLAPFNPAAVREIDFADGAAVLDVTSVGAAAADAGESVVTGSVEIEAIGAVRALRFSPLEGAWPLVRRGGTAQAVLTGIEVGPDADELLASMILRYTAGGPAFESHRVAALRQRGWLEFADGRRCEAAPEVDVTREQDGAIGLQYRVPRPPADWRTAAWVCPVPSVITRVPVTFSVRR